MQDHGIRLFCLSGNVYRTFRSLGLASGNSILRFFFQANSSSSAFCSRRDCFSNRMNCRGQSAVDSGRVGPLQILRFYRAWISIARVFPKLPLGNHCNSGGDTSLAACFPALVMKLLDFVALYGCFLMPGWGQ